MANETMQVLMRVFGFTQEDLQANRSGKLSASQQAEAHRHTERRWSIAALAFIVVIVMMGIIVTSSSGADNPRLVITLVVGAVVFVLILFPSTAEDKVKVFTGEIGYLERRFLDEGKLYFNLAGEVIMARVKTDNAEFAAPDATILQPNVEYRVYCRFSGASTVGGIGVERVLGDRRAKIYLLLSIEVLSTAPGSDNTVTPV